MIIRPGSQFVIERQLADPTDLATYYVRATVRNLDTDELVTTVNLTDKGSQRFRGTFTAPQERSGLGSYLAITTRVYSDSGYTTSSGIYADSYEIYELREPQTTVVASSFNASRGKGQTIDYEKVKSIISQAVKSIEKPEKLDLKTLIGELNKEMSKIIREGIFAPLTDTSAQMNQLAGAVKEISAQLGTFSTKSVEIERVVQLLAPAIKNAEKNIGKEVGIVSDILAGVRGEVRGVTSKVDRVALGNVAKEIKLINNVMRDLKRELGNVTGEMARMTFGNIEKELKVITGILDVQDKTLVGIEKEVKKQIVRV